MFPTPPGIRRACRGGVFVTLILLSAYTGAVIYIPIFIAMFLLRLESARFITDTIFSTWCLFACGLYELVFGVRIIVKGDIRKLDSRKSALLIMNHRTRLDWLFLLSVQARYGSVRRFKIVLKDALRHIPGAGWGMQCASFIFLKRSWDEDQRRMKTTLEHFERFGYRPQLLLFPEGTDLQTRSIAKSNAYAKCNDLPLYKYVIHPRVTGFEAFVKYMKSHNSLEQIVDITISYTYNMIQNESQLFTKELPLEIVFNVKTFDISELPTDRDLLDEWLNSIWAEKEAYLKRFYETDEASRASIDEGARDKEYELMVEQETKVYLVAAIVFWLTTIVTCFVLCIWSSSARWIFLFVTIFNISLSSLVGFDNLWLALTRS